jgi:Leucine-rich repeat (LRR) protein
MSKERDYPLQVHERLRICNDSKATYLDLSFCNLSEIPPEIKTFEWVTYLNVRVNNIRKISNLPANLKILEMSENGVTKISRGNIPNEVKNINLCRNSLSEVEDEALPLTLEIIDFENNELESVKFLKPYINLKSCNISNNKITTLENSIPENVTVLDCINNKLEELPKDMPIGIEELKLSYNELTYVRNIPRNLKKLWCVYNKILFIEALPENLELLDISHNGLTELPLLNNNNKLTFLDCSNNIISVVSYIPPSLTNLDLSKNEIEIIPTLPHGIKCDLSDNPCEKNIEPIDKRFPGTGHKLGTVQTTPTTPTTSTPYTGNGIHSYQNVSGNRGNVVGTTHNYGQTTNHNHQNRMSNFHWTPSYDCDSPNNPHKIIMNGTTEV